MFHGRSPRLGESPRNATFFVSVIAVAVAAVIVLATPVAATGQEAPAISRPWSCWAMSLAANPLFPVVVTDPACESFPVGVVSLRLASAASLRENHPLSLPTAPTSLVATVVGRTVTLVWLPPASWGAPPLSFVVEAGAAPGLSNLVNTDTGTTTPALIATDVAAGTYYIRVRARNADGTGPASNEVVVVAQEDCSGPSGAPSGLTAAVTGTSLVLTWQAPTTGCAPTFYVIEAGSSPGLTNLASFSTGSTATTFLASGIANGTYYARVRSGRQTGTSGPSNEVAFTIGTPPCITQPSTPAGLTAAVSGTTVVLTWLASSGSPRSYVVEAGSAPGLSDLVISDTGSTATTLTATAGVGIYYLRLRARNNCGTSAPSTEVVVTVTGRPPAAPVITTHPSNQETTAGSRVTFTAAASGEPTPSVQWQSRMGSAEFTEISGANQTYHTLTATAADDGREFRSVFTNSAGSATTSAARLTVTTEQTGPTITLHPVSQTVNAGAQVTFTAAATGSPAPIVQWQSRQGSGATFQDIPGTSLTSYTFSTTAADDGKEFRAVFVNVGGTATTNVAILTVTCAPSIAPVITRQPVDTLGCRDSGVTFYAAGSGCPKPTAQWKMQLGPYTGKGSFSDSAFTPADGSGTAVTNTSFRVDVGNSSYWNGTEVWVDFTNSAGTTTTNRAKLSVARVGTVVGPTDVSIVAGQVATFSASATGSIGQPVVQWQRKQPGSEQFAQIPGATSLTYSFRAAASNHGDQYRARFDIPPCAGDGLTYKLTGAASLTVYSAPSITQHPSNQTISVGATATLTAGASGNPAPTVQWQVSTDGGASFSDISGATSTSHRVTASAADNGRQYRAKFSNGLGTAYTNAATLRVS